MKDKQIPATYTGAITDGIENCGNDLKDTALHPIDTTTGIAKGVAAIVQDPIGVAKQAYLETIQMDPKEVVRETTAMAACAVVGTGLASGVRKLGHATKLAELKSQRNPHTRDYYDDVDDFIHTPDAHQGFALDTPDMRSQIQNYKVATQAKSTFKGSLPAGAATAWVTHGASDQSHDQDSSFISNAHAQTPEPTHEMDFDDMPEQEPHHQTREQFKKSYGFNEDNFNQEQSQKLTHVLNLLEEIQYKKTQEEKMAAASEAFNELENLGRDFNNPIAIKMGIIAGQAVKFKKNVDKIKEQIPELKDLFEEDNFLGTLLSGFDSVVSLAETLQPYLAIFSTIVKVAASFLGKPKDDPIMAMNIKYFEAILNCMNIIRKELREGFDEVNRNTKIQFEIQYLRFKNLLQMYQTIQLSNANQISKDHGEDTQHLEQVLSTFLKNNELRELDTLLVYLNRKDITEDELRKITTEVPRWLAELSSVNFNGGIYSTQSARQDLLFIGKGIKDVGSALGFLVDYARDKDNLGMADEFADIDPRKLPFISVWIYTVNAYLLALQLDEKLYQNGLNIDQLDEIIVVADNIIRFVDKTALHESAMLQKQIDIYRGAMEHLYDQLAINLAQELRSSEKAYSTQTLLNAGLLSTEGLKTELGATLTQKIIDHAQAKDPNIPILSVLAGKLKKGEFGFSSSNPTIVPPYVRAGDKDGCKDGDRRLYYYSFSASGSFNLHIISKEKNADLITGAYHKPSQQYHDACFTKKKIDGRAVELTGDVQSAHAHRHIHDLLGEATVSSFAANPYAQSTVNEMVAKEVAEHIVNKLKAGESLSDIMGEALAAEFNEIFNRAVTTTENDLNNNENALNTLAVAPRIAQANAELIGLPAELIKNIGLLMPSDAKLLLNSPSLYKTLNNVFPQLQEQVNQALPHRFSRIADEAEALKMAVNATLSMEPTFLTHKDNLNEWQLAMLHYKSVKEQLHFTKKIHAANPKLCAKETVDFVQSKCDKQKEKLNALLVKVRRSHDEVAKLGFDFTKVEFVEPEVVETETDKKVINFANNDLLDFSPFETAQHLESALVYLNNIPDFESSGRIRMGKTRRGKSVLGNFLMGMDYEYVKEKTGYTYVRPRSGGVEFYPSGKGKSITERPNFHYHEGIWHVDLMGFEDTEGTYKDIVNARLIKATADKFDMLEPIEVVMTQSDIYDGGYVEVRNVLGKIAKITTEPDNFILIINKASVEDQNFKELELEIYAYLKEGLNYIDEKSGPELFKLIQGLKIRNIFVADPTDFHSRTRYILRQAMFGARPRSEFDFDNFDKDNKKFNAFIDQFNQNQQALQDEVEVDFNDMMDNWETDSKRLIATVVPEILHYSDQIKQNEGRLERLNRLTPPKQSSSGQSWGSFNFPPGAAAAAPNLGAGMPAHIPDYAGMVNTQLIFAQWLCWAIKPFVPTAWFPGNCLRDMTSQEKKKLDSIDIGLNLYGLLINGFKQYTADPDYFEEQANALMVHRNDCRQLVKVVLGNNAMTDNQYHEILSCYQKITHRLQKLQRIESEGVIFERKHGVGQCKYDWLREKWVAREPEPLFTMPVQVDANPSSNRFWGWLYNPAPQQASVPMVGAGNATQNLIKPT